ncbi:MAG: dioxygenase [Actinobacteria bacterium]|nr:dioxygenase [Actinomycetota bacterium]
MRGWEVNVVPLHRLDSIRVAVPDADRQRAFYLAAGFTTDTSGSRFAGSNGGQQVTLEQGEFRRLLNVDVLSNDPSDISVIASRLTGLGITSSTRDGVLVATDPATRVEFSVRVGEAPPSAVSEVFPLNAPGHSERINQRASGVIPRARAPRRLGHIVIGSPDIDSTIRFLVEGFGFKVSDHFPGIIAFLRCSTDHHNVAVVNSEVPQLQHYSWECDDVDHVGHNGTALIAAGVAEHGWGFGRHYVGSNFFWYLMEPSGSFIEFFSDMDIITDDIEWETRGRTPVGPEHIGNSWGPRMPLEFIVPPDLDQLKSGWAKIS